MSSLHNPDLKLQINRRKYVFEDIVGVLTINRSIRNTGQRSFTRERRRCRTCFTLDDRGSSSYRPTPFLDLFLIEKTVEARSTFSLLLSSHTFLFFAAEGHTKCPTAIILPCPRMELGVLRFPYRYMCRFIDTNKEQRRRSAVVLTRLSSGTSNVTWRWGETAAQARGR